LAETSLVISLLGLTRPKCPKILLTEFRRECAELVIVHDYLITLLPQSEVLTPVQLGILELKKQIQSF
jgi:hypothetical protein